MSEQATLTTQLIDLQHDIAELEDDRQRVGWTPMAEQADQLIANGYRKMEQLRTALQEGRGEEKELIR